MAPTSQVASPSASAVLEGHLRECFGRVVYSHKTHEKCKDQLRDKLGKVKFAQMVLAAVSTGGGVTAICDIGGWRTFGAIVATLVSTALLILNAYTKENDLAQLAERHRKIGAELWCIREKYQALLVALAMNTKPVQDISAEADALLESLGTIYKDAPSTTPVAYAKAQEALQVKQDMTFEDGEIDKMLPPELRRNRGASPALVAPNALAAGAQLSAPPESP